jgi:lipopolysaccharide export system protein LptA
VIEARFRAEEEASDSDPGGSRAALAMRLLRLEGIGDVHIYSVRVGAETREARGDRFIHDVLTGRSVLLAAEDDPNARVEVLRGDDRIRTRKIEYLDRPKPSGGGLLIAPDGGTVEFEPPSDSSGDDRPEGVVRVTCRGPIRFARQAGRVTFERDVEVSQGAAVFQCDRLLAERESGGTQLRRIVGTGGVRLAMEEKAGRGDRFEWNVPGRYGVLTGTPHALARVSDRWVRGHRIRFEEERRRILVDGKVHASGPLPRRDR